MRITKNLFTVCLLLAACGCSSVPRYARHSVIPQLDFDKVPSQEAIGKLAMLIRQSNPSAPLVRVDKTPTLVIRPSGLERLTMEMDDLETRYRQALTAYGEQFVTFHARDIAVDDACRIVSTLTGMRVIYTRPEIIFRFGPKAATFGAYAASPQLIDELKAYPDDGHMRCFEPPPPWDETQMMSVDNGTSILLVGADEEQMHFEKELEKRRHNNTSDGIRQTADGSLKPSR